ncbi:hypothetical protein NHX12_020907 [Muraenolepis orangiensis]|uniref:Uncharacterized protein n=1 Tax=Muraenolepis orangiensis TaxID=630683 RepID=A0A9Q0IW73_9TELE|nr:hypothetical protein NHX12_020907 [Muraenolepis orangiensis]
MRDSSSGQMTPLWVQGSWALEQNNGEERDTKFHEDRWPRAFRKPPMAHRARPPPTHRGRRGGVGGALQGPRCKLVGVQVRGPRDPKLVAGYANEACSSPTEQSWRKQICDATSLR